ncbi:MAG: hypothetical protein SGBAC_006219, partial [Bacillariaceae sp.]
YGELMDDLKNDRNAQYDTEHNNKRHASQKTVKVVLLLIVVGTFSWVSNTTSSLSSISAFIQGGSSEGGRIGKVFNNRNQQQQRQENRNQAIDAASTVLLIHYHKTGNNFIVDLMMEIDRTHKERRHDLAMKDSVVLNRMNKLKGDVGHKEDATDTTPNNSEAAKRRRLTQDGDQTSRLEQRSRKQQSIKRGDTSPINQVEKAQKEMLDGGRNKHKASAVVDDEIQYYRARPTRNKIANRNKGQEALNQDQAKKGATRNKKFTTPKRSHDPLTGCPNVGNLDGLETGAVYRLTAPDLFCDLSLPVVQNTATRDLNETIGQSDLKTEMEVELDDGMKKSKDDDTARLPFPPWNTTKIVHFVRDPVDMALSNYLYHSQRPTPENWVLSRHLNPCATNDEFIEYILGELTASGSSSSSKKGGQSLPNMNITKDALLQVRQLCQYYRRDHPMANTKVNVTRAFYGLLLRLPPYDGLRMATTQFLLAQNPESGGDLLRMPNNIRRLQEWDEHAITAGEASSLNQQSHILTVSMGNIMKDMKGNIQEICDFVFGHISNVTIRSEVANDIADTMVAMYNAKERASEELLLKKAKGENEDTDQTKKLDEPISINGNSTMRVGSHLTQGLMNSTERRLLKEQLAKDPVLGSIMLQLQQVVNSVGRGNAG